MYKKRSKKTILSTDFQIINFTRIEGGRRTGKLRITPGIGYYRHIKSMDVEDSAGRPVSSAKKIGTEVDINFHYRIDKYVLFRFDGGYLFTDEGTGISAPDNAWKAETSIRVDF